MTIRQQVNPLKNWQLQLSFLSQIEYSLKILLLASVSVVGMVGCSQQKEVEYPPEVIPDIPPGDRTDEGTEPPS